MGLALEGEGRRTHGTMAVTLRIFEDGEVARRVDLGERTLSVGRAPDNDIVLDDPRRIVSRHHAEIRRADDGYEVVDRQSENGVWVDGARVERAALAPGRPVLLGTVRIEIGARPAPAVPAMRQVGLVAGGLGLLAVAALGVMLPRLASLGEATRGAAVPPLATTTVAGVERLTGGHVGPAVGPAERVAAARLGVAGASPTDAGPGAITRAELALARSDYAGAIEILEGLPETGRAAELLARARALRTERAEGLMSDGRQLERQGALDTAHRRYLAARAVDPATSEVDEAIARVEARMHAEGADAYSRARQHDALGRTAEAVALYEKAVLMLPPTDPSRATARERLDVLKDGER